MKVLILHLSDIHLEKHSFHSFQVSKIIDSFNSLTPFDEVLLILSGDIASRGIQAEYETAYRLVGSIIKEIKVKYNFNKRIHVLMVPGNHDVDLSNTPLTTNELASIRRNDKFDKYLHDELLRQTNFMNFAKRNSLFTTNGLFHQELIEFSPEHKIEVNLLNSALFSTLEEDKGLHYLPKYILDEIYIPTGANFVITIMHHPPDWFVDTIKNKIESLIYNKSSLVFFGHEHFLEIKRVSYERNEGVLIQAGGCLGEGKDWSQSAFHVGKLDLGKNEYNLQSYLWNIKERQYENTSKQIYALPNKPSIEKKITILSSYKKIIHSDSKQELGKDFTEYFVFPRIEIIGVNNTQNKEFINDDEFIKELLIQKKMMIYAPHDMGKTTLLKWMFLRLSKDYIPIFCDIENIKGKNSKRIIKSCFEDIYGEDPSDYERYLQLPKDKKILIIDDIDQIKPDHFERFITDIGNEFDLFIFSSKKIYDLDMLEKMKVQLKTTDSITKYQISMFYPDKRRELISKAVRYNLKGGNEVTDLTYVTSVTEKLSEAIKSQRKLIRLDPDFILKYVSYYCKNMGDIGVRNTNVFSKVFENNLVYALSKNAGSISVDKAFMLLNEIAYRVHFNKQYPIPIKLIQDSIEYYNTEYSSDVDFLEALNMFLDSKVLVQIEGEKKSYRFFNVSYLAFFTARKLNIQYNENGDDTDLQYIIKNACFSINSDILLFITYITDNIRILRYILDMVDNHTDGWEEFSLKNIPNYMRWKKNHIIDLPRSDVYEEQEKDEIKQNPTSENTIQVVDIYDYSEEEAEYDFNRMLRAIQLLSIVSKCLPIFEHMMKTNEKDKFVKQIYELPNKIFNQWSSKVEDEVEDIIQYFKYQPEHYYSKQKIASDTDIIKALQWVSMSMLLELYRMSMSHAVKENTIRYIESFPYSDNDLYQLQHLIALEIKGGPVQFVDKALFLKDKNEFQIYKTMLTRIVSHAYVFKKEMSYREQQKLESNFLNNRALKSSMIIKRTKNKKVNDE